MGHSGADYDCFGAAVGLQRAVRTLGKKPYIVYDNNSPAIKKMYDDLRAMSEYRGMFISNPNIAYIIFSHAALQLFHKQAGETFYK